MLPAKRYVSILVTVLLLSFLISILVAPTMSGTAHADPPLDDPALDAEEDGAVNDSDAYIVNPAMNYQGYLADSTGIAVNDILTFKAWLYNDAQASAAENLVWGPETHPDVQVERGLFSLVLGSNLALDPYDFYEALYLELEVDGTTLPRQPLRAVPYAMTLVPGAHVRGDWDFPDDGATMVRIVNEGNTYALYVSESGDGYYGLGADRIYASEGLASSAASYWWVPGSLAQPNAWDTPPAAIRSDSGIAIVDSGSGSGVRDIEIPISIPGKLYGHNVVLDEVRVYYRTSDSDSYINSSYLKKVEIGLNSLNRETVADNMDAQSSTTYSYYDLTLKPSPAPTLSGDAGPLYLHLKLYFHDSLHRIYIGNIRLKFVNPKMG